VKKFLVMLLACFCLSLSVGCSKPADTKPSAEKPKDDTGKKPEDTKK
jgi:hypothetical protein